MSSCCRGCAAAATSVVGVTCLDPMGELWAPSELGLSAQLLLEDSLLTYDGAPTAGAVRALEVGCSHSGVIAARKAASDLLVHELDLRPLDHFCAARARRPHLRDLLGPRDLLDVCTVSGSQGGPSFFVRQGALDANQERTQYLSLLKDLVSQLFPSPGKPRASADVFARRLAYDLRSGLPLVTTRSDVPFVRILESLVAMVSGAGSGLPSDTDDEGDACPVLIQARAMADALCPDGLDSRLQDAEGVLLRHHQLPGSLLAQVSPFVHMWVDDEGGLRAHALLRGRTDAYDELPWAVAGLASLVHLTAARCSLQPRELVLTVVDAFLHRELLPAACEQVVGARPLPSPRLCVSASVVNKSLSELVVLDDFMLVGYATCSAFEEVALQTPAPDSLDSRDSRDSTGSTDSPESVDDKENKAQAPVFTK